MKNCILNKWYVNIILFLVFSILSFLYVLINHDNLIICASDNSKQELCKTHIEKIIFDKIVPKNDDEKINTTITLQNGSKTYNFINKYGKYLGIIVGLLAMIIIFILYGFKFIIGLGKYKFLNVVSLILGYLLVFMLGLNFLYWEPRFTETGVSMVQFLGHPITLISFYFLVIIISTVKIQIFRSLFSNKKENEKNN